MDPKVASELGLRIPHLRPCASASTARAPSCLRSGSRRWARASCTPACSRTRSTPCCSWLANPGYGAGGMLTVELPTLDRAKLFMERLQNKHSFGKQSAAVWRVPLCGAGACGGFCRRSTPPLLSPYQPRPTVSSAGLMAVSLGYFDTLMSASAASTSSELSEAELARAGIAGGLVRLSVGITGSQAQRWEQLKEMWRHVAGVPLATKPTYKAALVSGHAIDLDGAGWALQAATCLPLHVVQALHPPITPPCRSRAMPLAS